MGAVALRPRSRPVASRMPAKEHLELLQVLKADDVSHANKRSLREHLVGTWRMLCAWECPAPVATAGLFHSIYSTEHFNKQCVPYSRRHAIRALIGAEAERYVYLFSVVPRDYLYSLVARPGASSLTISHHRRDAADGPITLTLREAVSLVLIHVANTLEQTSSKNGAPGRLLGQVSSLLAACHTVMPSATPSFADGASPLSLEKSELLRSTYEEGVRSYHSDPSGADAFFLRCTKMCAWLPEPYLWSASTACLSGKPLQAKMLATAGNDALEALGTTWDKRLGTERSRGMLQEILEHGSSLRANTLLSNISKRSLAAKAASAQTPARPTPVEHEAPATRFQTYLDSVYQERTSKSIRRYPGLKSVPWAPASSFALCQELESHFSEIAKEIHQLGTRQYQEEAEPIPRTGSWKIFLLYERGRKLAENCAKVPTLAAIIDASKDVRQSDGLIYVSRLSPGTHIAPHHGPTNSRLRCHLAVKVPEGDCRMRVAGEVRGWSEGRCTVFDDSYEHEVWNNTAEERIAVVIDLWHSDLSEVERRNLETLHFMAANQAQNLNRYWLRNEAERVAAADGED